MDFLRQAGQNAQMGQTSHQNPAATPVETGIPAAPAAQFALLNYLFPGYAMISSAANAYLGIDFNTYVPHLISIVVTYMAWNYIKDQFWSFFDDYFMSSVTLRTDDEIFSMVMLWLSKQAFSHNSRHFVANTNINSRNRFLYNCDSDVDDDDEDDGTNAPVDAVTGLSSGQKQTLHYTPSFGTHLFWYKMRPLIFTRVQNQDQGQFMSASEKEELQISCLGRNPTILKELLLEARQIHMTQDDRKTVIYRANLTENYWQRCMSRLNRPFSTVILNNEVKQDLIDDAADYLDPVTRRWYANRGIPYRRGYLLHGPPGTGKSSLSLALAGYFRMKIYIVSLSSNAATEENLTALFHELPTRCVVLLEDIDSAGLAHTRDDSDMTSGALASEPAPLKGSSPIKRGKARAAPASGRVSLSGLLNILDGVASQEGRILIMTTNHIEKLDKALIRPGRIDMTIYFGLADSTMTASIFRAIYAPYDNETTSKANIVDPDQEAMQARIAKKRAQISERVNEQAKKFAQRIPDLEFSPAEIQGLLLRHKRDPDAALAAAETWVVQMRKDKIEEAAEAERRRLVEENTRKEEGEEEGEEEVDEGGEEEGEEEGEEAEENCSERKSAVEDCDAEAHGSEGTPSKSTPKSVNSEGQSSQEAKVELLTDDLAPVGNGNPKKNASDSGYETP